MKKLFTMSAVALSLLGASYAFSSDEGTPHITLEAKNTASLREEFTESSVDTVKAQLIGLDQTLGPKEEINLYLDTPGGEVVAGKNLIEVIHGLHHKVNVIANFAASMGYLTTQGTTGKRYVTLTGILMSHRAQVGTEGFTPGNFETRVEFYKKMTTALAQMAADRTGISLNAYQDKVREEYWVSGSDAVKDKQADGVVTVSCSADLNGTTTETLYTMFGPVGIVWANCPLISEPVAIDFSGAGGDIGGGFNSSSSGYSTFKETITNGLMHKRDLLTSPALEEAYLKYVK